MRRYLLALALLTATSLASEPAPPPKDELTAGRYAVKIKGFLCRACARAVREELARLSEVSAVAGDFDHEEAVLTVRSGKRLATKKIRHALRRAGARMRISEFELQAIQYRPQI